MSEERRARAIMVMGTTSGAGKSLLVTALCRILSDRGLRVSPFKAQNMSLNSMVTATGEEMGRSQVLQAMAARVEPTACMNPILLKPKGGITCQVVVEGRPFRDVRALEYYSEEVVTQAMGIVRRNYDRLASEYDVIVIEGAGNPSEINMMDRDISNMRTAEMADATCLLVVNIEPGGAFAHLHGTLSLMEERHRRMFRGIVINNMWGDPSLLQAGVERIQELTGIPVIGIIPHMEHRLPDEDAFSLGGGLSGSGPRVGVIRLPMISNFTDFDPLLAEDGISLAYVSTPEQLRDLDALIIPGTKNTISDLKWMRKVGLYEGIRHLAGEIPILGICGGYQMLGRHLIDSGVEGGETEIMEGLCLLEMETQFIGYDKRTVRVDGYVASTGERVSGYEIHMGRSEHRHPPLFLLDGNEEGAISDDGMIMGTYLHGLFDLPGFRRQFLSMLGVSNMKGGDHILAVEESIDMVAKVVQGNLDIDHILKSAGLVIDIQ